MKNGCDQLVLSLFLFTVYLTTWAGHVVRMEKRNAYNILVGKPEGKRTLGRPRRRCMDNIKMDLSEIR
jgi:hypothetical protein